MGCFDFKLQRINLCKIILQALIKFDIKKKAKIKNASLQIQQRACAVWAQR